MIIILTYPFQYQKLKQDIQPLLIEIYSPEEEKQNYGDGSWSKMLLL